MLLAREAKKVHKSKAKVHQASSRNKGHLAATSVVGPVVTCERGLPQLPTLTATVNITQQQPPHDAGTDIMTNNYCCWLC